MSAAFSLAEAARERPDALALETAQERWSFLDLWRRVEPIAAWLASERGVGEPVGFVADARLETFLLIYAALEVGVPIVPLHPRFGSVERDAAARAWPQVRWLEASEWMAPRPRDLDERAIDAESPLAIVTTSGTTGAPKGIVLSRRAFLASAEASAQNLGWRSDDRWLIAMPLAHVGGLSVVTRCLVARQAILAEERFDVAAWCGAVERERATLASLVPTMLWKIFDEAPEWRPPRHLRAVLLGGDAASSQLLEAAAARGWPVLTTYGLSEACSQVTTQSLGSQPAVGEGSGKPLPGIALRIDGAGEIGVKGPTLASGYYPARPLPLDAEGYYPTGDLGRLDAHGRLHVVGRRSELIVSGGENVQPREVEDVLATHPAVAAVLVGGVPDPRWGEVVAALVVARDAAHPPRRADLEAWVTTRLSSHKRPRRYYVAPMLPRNAAGKLDRRAVAARDWDVLA